MNGRFNNTVRCVLSRHALIVTLMITSIQLSLASPNEAFAKLFSKDTSGHLIEIAVNTTLSTVKNTASIISSAVASFSSTSFLKIAGKIPSINDSISNKISIGSAVQEASLQNVIFHAFINPMLDMKNLLSYIIGLPISFAKGSCALATKNPAMALMTVLLGVWCTNRLSSHQEICISLDSTPEKQISEHMIKRALKKITRDLFDGTQVFFEIPGGSHSARVIKQNNFLLNEKTFKEFLKAEDGTLLVVNRNAVIKSNGLLIPKTVYKDLKKAKDGTTIETGMEKYIKIDGRIFKYQKSYWDTLANLLKKLFTPLHRTVSPFQQLHQ